MIEIKRRLVTYEIDAACVVCSKKSTSIYILKLKGNKLNNSNMNVYECQKCKKNYDSPIKYPYLSHEYEG